MMNTNHLKKKITGWGVDLDPRRRPGVPMTSSPKAAPGAHWTNPEQQRANVEVLKRCDLESLTPVFGTACPPRGLSGMIRRAAYKIPEHRPSHWALLLMGDRVDTVESFLRDELLTPTILIAAAGAGILFLAGSKKPVTRGVRREKRAA